MVVSWQESTKNYRIFDSDIKKLILEFEVKNQRNLPHKTVSIYNNHHKLEFVFLDSQPEMIKLIADALIEVYNTTQKEA